MILNTCGHGAMLALGLSSAGALRAVPPKAGGVMYRCPGNDYNNTISAKEAKDARLHDASKARRSP